MIVKVKEPQPDEVRRLRPGQVLFTYLHLAPDPEQCKGLIESGAVCIAYETVTQPGGGLPLLAPMSEVAGRMAVQAGAHCLEKAHGGMGILLGGVAGVPPAKIVILGAGVVGSNAAQIAVGTGALVVVIDRSIDALRRIDRLLGARAVTVFSNRDNIEHHVRSADLVIGGVLIPGAAAPKLVSRDLVGADEARARSWSTSRSTRAAASRPRAPPRTPSRPSVVGQRRALLRGEHAGRRAADVDLRAQQRDAALRAAAGRSGAGSARSARIRTWRTASTSAKAT